MNKRTPTSIFGLLGLFLVLFFSAAMILGCKREEGASESDIKSAAASPSDSLVRLVSKQQIISLAEQIVSEPNNWPNIAKNLAQMVKPLESLSLTQSEEYTQFESAAKQLMNVSTTWLSEMSESEKNRLSQTTKRLQAAASANAGLTGPIASGGVSSSVSGSADTSQYSNDKELRKVVGDKLTKSQANEFVDSYSKALATYQKLYRKVESTQ